MSTAISRTSVAILAAALVGTGVLVGVTGWPLADRTLEFPALLLAVIAVASYTARPSQQDCPDAMRPSFVIVMAALMLLGMPAAMVIAAAGEAADCLALSGQPRRFARIATSTAAALVAIQVAVVGAIREVERHRHHRQQHPLPMRDRLGQGHRQGGAHSGSMGRLITSGATTLAVVPRPTQ